VTTRYWWVNHNQTFRQEIEGGYLWSPKREANGARSQFYENMRIAAPNDVVLSFAHTQIANVGHVSDFALSAPKPSEFGAIGSNWAIEGWLLPIAWHTLRTPVRPKDIIEQLAPLLPAKYSPISKQTGNGNQKAYLAAIDEAVLQLVARESGDDGLLVPQPIDTRFADIVNSIDGIIEKHIQQDDSLSSTEKEQLVKARRGQGVFRSNLGQVENACRVTGITNQQLLIASHIKPWRACITAKERLDGYNGLLLTPNVDLLFDRGFISFTDDGQILISPKLSALDLERLGIASNWKATTKRFVPEQCLYLAYHRAEVFLQ
jgi:putative restriction endonuclease